MLHPSRGEARPLLYTSPGLKQTQRSREDLPFLAMEDGGSAMRADRLIALHVLLQQPLRVPYHHVHNCATICAGSLAL